MRERSVIFRLVSIVLVSLYLSLVLALLLLSRRIRPNPRGLLRLVRNVFRRRYRATLTGIRHDGGFCYVAPLPNGMISDADGRSSLVIFEDGRPLPYAHCVRDEIRERGEGRYSHWGSTMYFSALDNSDPMQNGRVYLVQEE